MSTLLQINSSLLGDQGQSSQLADAFVTAWRGRGVRPCLLPPTGVAFRHGSATAHRIPRCRLSRHLPW